MSIGQRFLPWSIHMRLLALDSLKGTLLHNGFTAFLLLHVKSPFTQMPCSGLSADEKQKLLATFATEDFKCLADEIKANARAFCRLMTCCPL
jgi:hypothetical protein